MAVTFPGIRSLTEKMIQQYKDKKVARVYFQEKLDGCNLRCVFNADGAVSFGTRRENLEDGQDFHGFSCIKESLTDSTLRLAKLLKWKNAPDINIKFVVFGELIGRPETGKPINGRIDYHKGKNTIEYYAYEIFVNVDAFDGPQENLITYRYSMYKFDKVNGEFAFLNFELAQKILKDAGFNVIPYVSKTFEGEGIAFDKVVIPPFKSLLFKHENEDETEGYVLRFLFSDSTWLRFKFKSPNFEELDPLSKAENPKERLHGLMENSWISFLSKYSYEKISNDNAVEILVRFADDLKLERTKDNFAFLQKFVAQKMFSAGVKGKLSIFSGTALEKFLNSSTTREKVE